MKFDGDKITLSETEVAECIVAELSRRELVTASRPYYVRFTLSPEGTFAIVPGGDPLKIVTTIEPREHS